MLTIVLQSEKYFASDISSWFFVSFRNAMIIKDSFECTTAMP